MDAIIAAGRRACVAAGGGVMSWCHVRINNGRRYLNGLVWGRGLARGEAGAAGGVLAGAADGDAGAEAMGAAMGDPFLLIS